MLNLQRMQHKLPLRTLRRPYMTFLRIWESVSENANATAMILEVATDPLGADASSYALRHEGGMYDEKCYRQ